MKRVDGRAKARENEMRVLRALHRFGWLRTRDIAALWARWASKPMATPSLAPAVGTASDLRMAQRTLRRMRDGHLLLQAQGSDGSVIYAIAEGGARALQSADVPASSGKDGVRNFSSGYFRHRCIANELAIAGIVQGFRVSTEREIARGLWAGGEVGIAGKKPDALWRSGNRWEWFEVERSRRNARDYAQLQAWLLHLRGRLRPGLGADMGDGVVIERVVFVCTAQFKSKLLRDLATQGWPAGEVQKLVVFETLLYKFEGIIFC
jgi:hypothetical protein